jgi:ADP-heptose:LPS heptosyltransferase
MGLGDDIMFLGEAEKIHKKTGMKVRPVGGTGWSILFEQVDFITQEDGIDVISVNRRDGVSGSQSPVKYYIENQTSNKVTFRNYKPKPFNLKFSNKEKNAAKQLLDAYNIQKKWVVINPDYKNSFFNENKNWGFDKFQELTNKLSEHIQVVRFLPGTNFQEPLLENAVNIETPDIRLNLACLQSSTLGVSFDGLYIHVMSGMNIPCVNIMGGLLHPNIMSYEGNINLYYKHPNTPCGMKVLCEHCKEGNASITVDQVYEACMLLLKEEIS